MESHRKKTYVRAGNNSQTKPKLNNKNTRGQIHSLMCLEKKDEKLERLAFGLWYNTYDVGLSRLKRITHKMSNQTIGLLLKREIKRRTKKNGNFRFRCYCSMTESHSDMVWFISTQFRAIVRAHIHNHKVLL